MRSVNYAMALVIIGFMPSYTFCQSDTCYDENNISVGDRGKFKILKNDTKIILSERKGGEQCSCSYVSVNHERQFHH